MSKLYHKDSRMSTLLHQKIIFCSPAPKWAVGFSILCRKACGQPFFSSWDYINPYGAFSPPSAVELHRFTVCFLVICNFFTFDEGKSKNRIDISPQVCYNVCIHRRIYNHIEKTCFFRQFFRFSAHFVAKEERSYVDLHPDPLGAGFREGISDTPPASRG